MEATNTISVEQEVEAILTTNVAQYSAITGALSSPTREFYKEVAAELTSVLRAYQDRNVPVEVNEPEPEGFKVGDRVVLVGPSWEAAGIGGQVVEINDVESDGGASFDDPRDGTPWYTEPDPTSNWYARLVDDTIRVGDTMRITEAYGARAESPNEIGTEFVVTGIVTDRWRHSATGKEFGFYVTGDPAQRGIWDLYIEKVHA